MSEIRICLDAGHYGKYNRSPAVREYYESDFNWKFHLLLKKQLESYGMKVITTRADKDKDMNLLERGRCGKGCNLLISIHSNAVGNEANESIDHPVAFVPLDGTGDAIAKKLVECVHVTMGTKEAGRIATRKADAGYDWYGINRGAASVGCPNLILEHSFHTNTKAAKWLLVDANLEKLAEAEAKVIAEHFNVAKKVTESAKPVATPTTSTTTSTCTLVVPMLKQGAKGQYVKTIQQLLIWKGFSCGSTGADGDFGKNTDKAVKAYQSSVGLTADGIVGTKTAYRLFGV